MGRVAKSQRQTRANRQRIALDHDWAARDERVEGVARLCDLSTGDVHRFRRPAQTVTSQTTQAFSPAARRPTPRVPRAAASRPSRCARLHIWLHPRRPPPRSLFLAEGPGRAQPFCRHALATHRQVHYGSHSVWHRYRPTWLAARLVAAVGDAGRGRCRDRFRPHAWRRRLGAGRPPGGARGRNQSRRSVAPWPCCQRSAGPRSQLVSACASVLGGGRGGRRRGPAVRLLTPL